MWLSSPLPLSLRGVEEMPAVPGIAVGHGTVQPWGLKVGQEFANRIRGRGRSARVLVTDRLRSYGAAQRAIMSGATHGRGTDSR